MSRQVTEHFAVEEFACHDGTPYPAEWVEERLRPLCETLEVIRAMYPGSAVVVDSGYRTLAYDAKLYEASAKDGKVAPPASSQHPVGRAADIKVMQNGKQVPPSEVFEDVMRAAVDGRLPHLGGVGRYPTFVHVDVRPRPASGHVAVWGGDRLSNLA